MERRFHSPYRHWVSGLLIELAVFAAFAVLLSLAAILVAKVAG